MYIYGKITIPKPEINKTTWINPVEVKLIWVMGIHLRKGIQVRNDVRCCFFPQEYIK